jgi:hypothetical protein
MNIEEVRRAVRKGIFERNRDYLASHGYFENEDSKFKLYDNYIAKLSDKQYRSLHIMNIIHGKFDRITKKSKKTIFINDNLSIIKVALHYGLKVKGNKVTCPFHKDKDPSLVFYVDTNSFHCFGCKVSGDVITLIQMLEEIKNG